jgi:hypothetical protein
MPAARTPCRRRAGADSPSSPSSDRHLIAAALAVLPAGPCAALVIGGGMVAFVGHCDDLKGLPILLARLPCT